MPTSNVNDEMRQTAEYAIRIARERFGKQLDYSEGSLPTLEYIIEQAHQQFNANKVEGKISNDTALNRTDSVWGSYLGELIRGGKKGGTWIIEESKRLVVVNDFKFSPIDYVYQRITGQLQGNVKEYFDDVYIKLSSQPINFVQPEPNLPNSAYTFNQSQTEPSKAKVSPKSASKVERILGILAAVSSIFLIGWLSYLFLFPTLFPQNAYYVLPQPTAIPSIRNIPTKTPKPTFTKLAATSTRVPTNTLVPTNTQIPTNTPFFPNMIPVEINDQNYQWVWNPIDIIETPNTYKNKRIYFSMFVKNIIFTSIDGEEQLILSLGISRSKNSRFPVLVFGLKLHETRASFIDIGMGDELAVYGIGMGEVNLQTLNKLFNEEWLLPLAFYPPQGNYIISCMYGEKYFIVSQAFP